MKLAYKNILLISPELWGVNHVSKHHYAIELAKRNNTVYFLNPPSNRFKIKQEQKKLFIFDYKPKYRGLSKMPEFISAILIKKEISRLEKSCHTTFDIIWNFDSSSFFNLKLVKSKLKISHIVDYSEDKNVKLLNNSADICLCTSNYILERQKKYNTNAYNIGHGYSHFENLSPINIRGKSDNIKVGYVGNLLIKYLDWELIYKLVKKNPNIDYFFAGPYEKSNLSKINDKPKFLVKTMKENNSWFIGPISPFQISSFLSQMDILLLVYKTDEFKVQLANPHKILEYLSSGNTIVASWTDEFKNNRDLLEMVEDNAIFIDKFNQVISNLTEYNSSAKQKTRIRYALNHTYDKKLQLIESYLNQTHG